MCAMRQTQARESDQYMELSDFTDEYTDYGQSRSKRRPVRGSTTDSTTDSVSFSMPMKVDNGTDKVNQTTLQEVDQQEMDAISRTKLSPNSQHSYQTRVYGQTGHVSHQPK